MLMSVQNRIQSMPISRTVNYNSGNVNFKGNNEIDLVKRCVDSNNFYKLTETIKQKATLGRIKVDFAEEIINAIKNAFEQIIRNKDSVIDSQNQRLNELFDNNRQSNAEIKELNEEIKRLKATLIDPKTIFDVNQVQLPKPQEITKVIDTLVKNRKEYLDALEDDLFNGKVDKNGNPTFSPKVKEFATNLHILHKAYKKGFFKINELNNKCNEFFNQYNYQGSNNDIYSVGNSLIPRSRLLGELIPTVLKYSKNNTLLQVDDIRHNVLERAYAMVKILFLEEDAKLCDEIEKCALRNEIERIMKFQDDFNSGVEKYKKDNELAIKNGTVTVEVLKNDEYRPWFLDITTHRAHYYGGKPEHWAEDEVKKMKDRNNAIRN